MIPLPLAWTLLTLLPWTLGSSPILLQENVKEFYPELLSNVTIECDCFNISCASVSWFRTIPNHNKVQFLGQSNNADRFTHGKGVEAARFRFSRRSNGPYLLRIIKVTQEDEGFYSCVLRDSKGAEVWRPGNLLWPGVTPPTLPPKTIGKPPSNSVCRCSKNPLKNGCGSHILWTLVGLIAALALSLICTLYYFSRLPKKCRHRFTKRR